MKTSQIRDYFQEKYGWQHSISIGKIDNNQEKAICFYGSKRTVAYAGTIGGKQNRTTEILPISILIRYTKNQDSAEQIARSIYNFFEERRMTIDNKQAFVEMYTNAPINLGTDDKGVYEYSIEIDIHSER